MLFFSFGSAFDVGLNEERYLIIHIMSYWPGVLTRPDLFVLLLGLTEMWMMERRMCVGYHVPLIGHMGLYISTVYRMLFV